MFREYPTTLLGLAAGQVLNLAMSLVGLALIIVPLRRARAAAGPVREPREPEPLAWRPALLAAILVFSLVIPSDWTQDVPARYGVRHPGLQHSPVYPKLDTSPAH